MPKIERKKIMDFSSETLKPLPMLVFLNAYGSFFQWDSRESHDSKKRMREKMKKRYGIIKTISYDASAIFETDEFDSVDELKNAIFAFGESRFEFNWDSNIEYLDEAWDIFEMDAPIPFEITDAGMEIVRGLQS